MGNILRIPSPNYPWASFLLANSTKLDYAGHKGTRREAGQRLKLTPCWVYQSPGIVWLSFCSFLALLCVSCSIPILNLRSRTTFFTFSQATVTQCLLFCFGLLVVFVLISILPRYSVQTPSKEDREQRRDKLRNTGFQHFSATSCGRQGVILPIWTIFSFHNSQY